MWRCRLFGVENVMLGTQLQTWSRRRFFKQFVRLKSDRAKISSKEIRKIFLDFYIGRHGHEYVHSSSIIPPKDQGTYFTNAGMNQFKPIFLGTAEPGSQLSVLKRVANSQKCVRVGGKHNDLDDVGRDLTHHTFFEMLGSWSFGDYFKTEACSMALELLTNVYGIPLQRLYLTYFGGSSLLNLPADEETREAWLQLGVPANRVLPFGMKDNFWDMGDTGPCGPCTEIHYDHMGDRDASSLVNTGSPDVVELWNIVFMQFDRQADETLVPLPQCHVDTGLGFERLCAVLQGVGRSNYDTDLFLPIFKEISQAGNSPMYEGRTGEKDIDGKDTAYRIVADHTRLATVAIGDGLLPGNGHLEHKLRQILHRCIHQGYSYLKLPHGSLATLVDVVVETLADAFPEVSTQSKKIKDVILLTEDKYRESLAQGKQTFEKFLRRNEITDGLSGDQVIWLYEGRYGSPVPLEIITNLAAEKGLTVDLTVIEQRLQDAREMSYKAAILNKNSPRMHLDQHDLRKLKDMGVPETDDSGKYQYRKINNEYDFLSPECVTICAVLHDGKFVDSVATGEECGVVLNCTNFYSENGGQIADKGYIITQNGKLRVTDVQKYQGYVLHTVTVETGKVLIKDHSSCQIEKNHRLGCLRNHTATHLLNSALRRVLGHDGISQRGSLVTAEKLTFDFTYLGTVENSQLNDVESNVREVILQNHDVARHSMALSDALSISNLVKLDGQTYPSHVCVVSVGEQNGNHHNSVELCGGTHVENTGDLEEICIVRMSSVSMGVKRLTAVTGRDAKTAIGNSKMTEDLYKKLVESVNNNSEMEKWTELEKEINKNLNQDLFQKCKRDEIKEKIKQLGEKMSRRLNKSSRNEIRNEFLHQLNEASTESFVARELTMTITLKEIMKSIQSSPVAEKPTFLLMRKDRNLTCLVYVPQVFSYTSENVAEELVQRYGGKRSPAKGKNSEQFHLVILNSTENVDQVLGFVKNILSKISPKQEFL